MQKWILEADIKGCFDNINHEKLLEKLSTTNTQRRMIRQMLKSGCMDRIKHYKEHRKVE